jgi:hypothetical protein
LPFAVGFGTADILMDADIYREETQELLFITIESA